MWNKARGMNTFWRHSMWLHSSKKSAFLLSCLCACACVCVPVCMCVCVCVCVFARAHQTLPLLQPLSVVACRQNTDFVFLLHQTAVLVWAELSWPLHSFNLTDNPDNYVRVSLSPSVSCPGWLGHLNCSSLLLLSPASLLSSAVCS